MRQHSCSLFSLFAAYWTQYDAVALATKITGSAEDGTASFNSHEINDPGPTYRLNEVTLRICAFVPRVRLEAYLKTRFLEAFVAENGGVLEGDAVTALLSSMPNLIAADAAADHQASRIVPFHI